VSWPVLGGSQNEGNIPLGYDLGYIYPCPAVSQNNRFWYIATVPNFLKVRELAKEPEILYQFFHEEINRSGGSLFFNLFSPKNWNQPSSDSENFPELEPAVL